MRILVTELTFSLAHVRNQNEKEVKTLIKKNTQNECKKKTHKVNVKKKYTKWMWTKKTQNECKQRKYKMNTKWM